ncbi:hypothetical protein [Streptomyces sp. NPDC005438]|uniref:hypothetical protein n=1 Tax=Streptomyces sp. NPDC005438 TaxID=3156880 RepID=UPI0033A9660E
MASPPTTPPLVRLTRATERLLCGSLGTAMAVNALQAFVRPDLPWFSTLWLGLWILTGALFPVWAGLRAAEKARYARHRAADEGPPGSGPSFRPGTAYYGQAA